MAQQQHKSASEISYAPLQDKTLMQEWVQRYGKLGLLVFAVISAGILGWEWQKERKTSIQDQGWAGLQDLVTIQNFYGMSQVNLAEGAKLEDFGRRNKESGAGIWARTLAGPAFAEKGDYGRALNSLQELAREQPNHPLVAGVEGLSFDGGGLVKRLETRLAGLQTLRAELPLLVGNPAPPADAPRVRIDTSAGQIEVALFPAKAPKHVENFLKLAQDGTYVGTKFHRVIPNFMIQGGDQNSKEGPPETWGTGDAGYKLAPEFSDLGHFRGALAMAKKDGESESSGHQFYITVGEAHWLDDVHTVFGVVVSGQEVADAIANAPKDAANDRPNEPVVVNGVTVQ
jgi:peptidyl-prolyl cis-trans isomerase B (cyclophilin B)